MIGAIAFNEQGHKGLVVSQKGESVFGFHLGPDMIGRRWTSASPRIVQQTFGNTFRALGLLLMRARRLKKLDSTSPAR